MRTARGIGVICNNSPNTLRNVIRNPEKEISRSSDNTQLTANPSQNGTAASTSINSSHKNINMNVKKGNPRNSQEYGDKHVSWKCATELENIIESRIETPLSRSSRQPTNKLNQNYMNNSSQEKTNMKV